MLVENRKGKVLVNGRLAGFIIEYRDNTKESYTFTYDDAYLSDGSPIGYHFPISEKHYEFDTFPPFFANLVSEGWLRAYQSKKARLDKTDSFGLLLANGEELIGAVSILPMEQNN